MLALCLKRKVDHHDRVFLHDADQQYDPDQRHHTQFGAADQQSQNGSDTCRRERRKNRERMNVTLIENTENDIHRHNRRQNQPGLVFQCGLESLRCSLERGLDAQRHPYLSLCLLDGFGRRSKRCARRQIE